MESVTGGIILLQLVFFAAFMIFGVIGFAFWIWVLIDCVKNEPSEGNDKLIWILVIVLTGWIGGLIYLFFRRPERKRNEDRLKNPPPIPVSQA